MKNNSRPMFIINNSDKVELNNNETNADTIADIHNTKDIKATGNKSHNYQSTTTETTKTRLSIIINFIIKNLWKILIAIITTVAATLISKYI